MVILTVHWDLRLMWELLTITAKFYVLCLLAGVAYSTYSLARTASRLPKLLKHTASTHRETFSVTEMMKRLENLRQFHALLLLLFGVCCANEVFATVQSIKLSSMSLSAARIDVFEPVILFAFFVFLVFAFLHALQWVVAARLQSSFAANFNQSV